jgi:hypothetical protein
MKINILPFVFELNTATIAGSCLWSLAFYLGSNSLKEWIIESLKRWLDFAERSFYTSGEEYEQTREARESQNAFYASVLSIFPFLVIGFISNWLIEISFGGSSWGISLGIMTCAICSLYALARQNEF